DLHELDPACILFAQLFKHRGNHAAGAAPHRPKIYKNGLISLENFALKVRIRDFHYSRHCYRPFSVAQNSSLIIPREAGVVKADLCPVPLFAQYIVDTSGCFEIYTQSSTAGAAAIEFPVLDFTTLPAVFGIPGLSY